eukprot:COSAG02_NODE_9474_length_2205_cov_1.420228_4_plen_59_part_00
MKSEFQFAGPRTTRSMPARPGGGRAAVARARARYKGTYCLYTEYRIQIWRTKTQYATN